VVVILNQMNEKEGTKNRYLRGTAKRKLDEEKKKCTGTKKQNKNYFFTTIKLFDPLDLADEGRVGTNIPVLEFIVFFK
jgi:hypothetical protein